MEKNFRSTYGFELIFDAIRIIEPQLFAVTNNKINENLVFLDTWCNDNYLHDSKLDI